MFRVFVIILLASLAIAAGKNCASQDIRLGRWVLGAEKCGLKASYDVASGDARTSHTEFYSVSIHLLSVSSLFVTFIFEK